MESLTGRAGGQSHAGLRGGRHEARHCHLQQVCRGEQSAVSVSLLYRADLSWNVNVPIWNAIIPIWNINNQIGTGFW